MSRWIELERKTSSLLERLLITLLFLIFATVVVLVVLRYAFNTTMIGGNEWALIAFVYSTAIGGALAVAKDEHIAIRYFVDLLPPGMQPFFRILQLAMVAAVNAAIVGYSFVWIGKTGGFLMPALQLPQAVAQLSVSIGCSLALVYCLIGIRRRIATR